MPINAIPYHDPSKYTDHEKRKILEKEMSMSIRNYPPQPVVPECITPEQVRTGMDQQHKYKEDERVNHPDHYTWLKEKCGIEVIDITRHFNFCRGNALKYLLRAGHKDEASISAVDKEIEDLRKAMWYIKDEIMTLENTKTCLNE